MDELTTALRIKRLEQQVERIEQTLDGLLYAPVEDAQLYYSYVNARKAWRQNTDRTQRDLEAAES